MTVEEYINKLSLEEKAALLQGKSNWTTWNVPRLLLPSMFLSDGPHGLRKQVKDKLGAEASHPSTCFPTAATVANSWDPELGGMLGRALGAEAAAHDVHVVLGPGLNIKRSPLCGRNFEYFSEDPYLSGKMAAAYVRGIQSKGVVACLKHYAANSQELHRMSVDSVVDMRTLREIYLTGFEIGVKEGKAKAVMTSYGKVGGTYANENGELMMLLREWGFNGFTVSDWGACNDPVAAIAAGGALNMPDPGLTNAQRVCDAVRAGELEETKLDDRLRELLPLVLATQKTVSASPKTYDRAAHHGLARRCAAESVVLLENDGILPLRPGTSVAVIGDFAKTPRYQGAGSSLVVPTQLDSLLDALEQTELKVSFAQGYRRDGKKSRALIDEAVALAKDASVVLLCVGLDELSETEGRDRKDLELPQIQRKLITAVTNASRNVVLVLSGGAPFLLPPSERCRAVIHGYLGGQAGGSAMADVLTGKVCPSGHLAESWPMALEDTPCYRYYPGRERTAQYREGPYVGYRYYDTADVPVRYPFGHGLSYTSFAYSELVADSHKVSFTLTNTGSRDGAEVAQVYIGTRTGKVFRPKKELKGFQKVFLKAGESRQVTIELDDKAFRYFNVTTGRFEMETAHYVVSVGSSVRDIRLTATLRLIGTDAPAPYATLPSYDSGTVTDVPDYEFTALLGRQIPESGYAPLIGIDDPIDRFSGSKNPCARWLYRCLVKKLEKKKRPDLAPLFLLNMPIRALSQMTNGKISHTMTADILLWVNGQVWRPLPRLLRGYFQARKTERAYRKELHYGPRDH